MSDYSHDCLQTLVGKAWDEIMVANAGVCTNLGWHLEVTARTVLVITYTDCDDKTLTYRIIL